MKTDLDRGGSGPGIMVACLGAGYWECATAFAVVLVTAVATVILVTRCPSLG